MSYNEYISNVEAELNTNTGELHLTIFGEDEEELLKTTCKLSKATDKEDSIVRFSMDNHPETGKKESFKGVVSPKNHGGWGLYIYPQFGVGTICRGRIRIETTGENEYFQH